MKVLFVHSEEDHYSPEKPLEGYDRMQFGISYISSVLQREGHETRLVVPTRETTGVVEEHVSEFEPGLVCFTSVYSVFDFLSEAAARVKRAHPDIFLLAGGPHASLRPDDCLESAFDAVCVGEGEFPTLELAASLEEGRHPKGIANLHIRNGGEIERSEPRPFMEDIDSLPFPDRDMWKPWLANILSRHSVLAGRGCPFQCTYCCNHALAALANGRYVRLRSPASIAAEVEGLPGVSKWPVEVYLEVETLGADQDWALELCSVLERMNERFEAPVTYGSNLRVTPNASYDDLFEAFRRANFRFVNIGLESGSERVRREILKRNYSNADILRAVSAARDHGLEVGMYNLIGLPGETKKDFRETVRVTRACQPDWFLLSVFFPYPGTALHETCTEQGLLEESPDRVLERRRPALDLPGFTKRQVRRRYTWSPLLFYGGHKPLSEILWLVSRSRIFSSRRLLKLWRAFRGRRSEYRSSE